LDAEKRAGTAAGSPPADAATAGGAAPSACGALKLTYERSCLASWRRYWDDRYRNGRPIVGRKA
jgi:hypothetical protein